MPRPISMLIAVYLAWGPAYLLVLLMTAARAFHNPFRAYIVVRDPIPDDPQN